MTHSEWCLTATPWIAFACNVAVNIMLLRTCRHITIVRSLACSFLVGCAAFVMLAGLWLPQASSPEMAIRMTTLFLTYACVSYVFFHIVHIPEASVRIRILQELVDNGPLTVQGILSRYDARHILEIRLERLTRSGQILCMDGRFITGRKRMLHIARLFRLLKRITTGTPT